ncbi:PVC-type heme-binding CxxCH protein [Neorhodopirellula pilleata]|uniref:FG-GAP repeat protein n=1 Tax=Neorhodopirellula pilleata TaxID=2714738 RepID=A0A5C5ZI01_9BACT|nr:PVC-type heme-binding CxxCH protein [Neorhodopirellula pilleata]TWT86984.1 FG-GAP repeat protein [Neorhodopirellula pilleata]
MFTFRESAFLFGLGLIAWFTNPLHAQTSWRTQRIHNDFLCEGAASGDLNGDGQVDLVAGPVWYAGPGFEQRFEIAEPKVFSTAGYSDQFFSHVLDFNNDGRNDVLSIGFPGRSGRLYLNPGQESLVSHWPVHEIMPRVSHESPALVDLIPGGLPELVASRDRSYGFYTAGEDPTQPWRWTAISEPGTAAEPFGHGLGVGDIDGDGRLDIVDHRHWWKHPNLDVPDTAPEQGTAKLWQMRTWASEAYGRGGAQIHVHDVDGDGDNDLVTSHNAHGYGLSWFEQLPGERFQQHFICGESSIENPYGFAVSQLHAVELVDIDGDGLKDIVTGKRRFAHGGKDPGGLQAPIVAWFQCVRSGGIEGKAEGSRGGSQGIEFVPHIIDDQSGVGVEVLVADLNNDQQPDVVSSNKLGLSVHFQEPTTGNRQTTGQSAFPWTLAPSGNVKKSQDEYADGFSPQQAVENMDVPPGFKVDLIASEPDLVQPIAMCFDDRGRIWVIEGHTYPQKAPEGQGMDRILILEDTDADGSFDQRTVFAEGLNLASGIEVGFGGVWVGAAPDLLFYPDADRDDVPDGPPRVMLDGWGYQDTHETLNSFTWGPDGWLYGCHGVFTHSRVGKPGTPDQQRVPINAGVWRFHPVRHEFEVYAHGTSNPWGVDFNEDGDWFITACVIPHLYHLSQGGRYFRQAGNHFETHTYDDIKTIADHLHYGDGTFESSQGGKVDRQLVARTAADTSAVGGGHAHCGLTIYQADEFPAEYRGELFFHNLHGHRMVRDHVERDGSGFVGRHRPDFAMSHDHRQIGVGVMQGPDGALYTSDWHDPQTCHNRNPEIWDRTDGRLFRIRFGDVQPYRFDLNDKTDEELIDLLEHSNAYFVRRAQRLLHERSVNGSLSTELVNGQLNRWIDSDRPRRERLQAVWTMWVTGGLGVDELKELLSDDDPIVRGWAVQFIGEAKAAIRDDVHAELASLCRSEPSSVTRRYLASLLQRIPLNQRWSLAEGLLRHSFDRDDRNLPWLIWYGIEPLVEEDPSRAFELARGTIHETVRKFVIRRMAVSDDGRESIVAMMGNDDYLSDAGIMIEELLEAAWSRGGVGMPASWPQVAEKLRKRNIPIVRDMLDLLAIQFGDQSAFPAFRKRLDDRSLSPKERREALSLLAQANDPELPDALIRLIDDPAIGGDAIRSLARTERPEVTQRLIERFRQWPVDRQADALATLTARTGSVLALVAAMETDLVNPTTIPAYAIRQMIAVGDREKAGGNELRERIEKVWGRVSQGGSVPQSVYQRYLGLLDANSLARADRVNGKRLYDANCGKCHRLFGEGQNIGPDLTGANRQDIKYWLENILEPNSIIGKAYQTTQFVTDDGRVVIGLVQSENDDAVTVTTANETIVLPKSTLELRQVSEVSLMPEGQLEPMTPAQVRELFGYLMSPGPIVSSKASDASAAFTRPGALEGETLIEAAEVSAGKLSRQGMSGFPDRWSSNQQLWWTGGKVGETLSVEIPVSQSGPARVTFYFTTAPDYAQIEVGLNDQAAQSIDLYTPDVRVSSPVVFTNAKPDAGGKLVVKIRITGRNSLALERYMVGLDSITIEPMPGSGPR